jgi:hypothetical protein
MYDVPLCSAPDDQSLLSNKYTILEGRGTSWLTKPRTGLIIRRYRRSGALDSSNLDKYWPEGNVNVTCNKCGQYKEGEQNRRQRD